jgi:SAM-dependent methyltransferase
MTETQSAAEYWENRYRENGKSWSGSANAALVREINGVAPGSALDLGCGEGGDALWLAHQGWSVTAVDIAPSALAIGAAEQQPGDDITWIAADLSDWLPPRSYDLVSSCFLHSTVDLPRERILRRAAAAVAPGGQLLVVGHSGAPHWDAPEGHHHHAPEELPTPDEVLASLRLEDGDWDVLTNELVERPDARLGTTIDGILRLRRRVE